MEESKSNDGHVNREAEESKITDGDTKHGPSWLQKKREELLVGRGMSNQGKIMCSVISHNHMNAEALECLDDGGYFAKKPSRGNLKRTASQIELEEVEKEDCHTTDKWEILNADTVTSVTACDDYIAWGSQNEENKYGVYITRFNETHEKPHFYPTGGIVQALDFNDSCKATELVCADFTGNIFIYKLRVEDPEKRLLLKKKVMETHLTAVSFQRDKDKHGEAWIAIGTDDNQVHLYKVPADNTNLIPVQAADKTASQNEQDLVIKRDGKVLDVEFLWKQEQIQLVIADDSGQLSVFEMIKESHRDVFTVYSDFEQNYNLTVESGCMLSSSDNGHKIVFACGNKKAIVLERVKREKVFGLSSYMEEIKKLEEQERQNGLNKAEKLRLKKLSKYHHSTSRSHDTWEEAACFSHDSLLLSVDLSGDGKRLAVATENKEAAVYDVDFGCKIRSFQCGGRVRSVCLDDKGQHLVVGGFDKKLLHFNVEAGFHKSYSKTFEGFKKVQSVSLDDGGKLLAIGFFSGDVKVYRVDSGFSTENAKPLWQIKKEKVTYVVKLSPDGKFLAIGDYNNEVNIYDINKPEEEKVFSKKYEEKLAFIWGLDFKVDPEDGNNYILAVGSWNGYAYVYHLKSKTGFLVLAPEEELHVQAEFVLKREDRVFDVCLTDDGHKLAVGGRDKKIAVYELYPANDQNVIQKLKFEKEDVERVYCCAISPEGTYAVYGGISKKLILYRVEGESLLHTYDHKGTVNRVEFMNEETFCAVSEDGRFAIYQVHCPMPMLMLKLDGTANSIALSKTGVLVVGHGQKVAVFGKTEGYGPLDCPSMSLATQLLDDPESLGVALNSHPTLVNLCDSRGKTLLHYAVENDNMAAIDMILKSPEKCGLLVSDDGDTALMCAIFMSRKMIVDMLLSAIISKDIANTPAMFRTLFSMQNAGRYKGKSHSVLNFKELEQKKTLCVFQWIGLEFPDVLIRFLGGLRMEKCEEHVQGDLTLAPVTAPILLGLTRRSPKNFWDYYFNLYQIEEDGFLDNSPEYAVQAYRLPIPGICGCYTASKAMGSKASRKYQKFNEEDNQTSEDNFCSPLEVIVNASRTLKDYSIFDKNTIVHDLVMYKWRTLESLFKASYYNYLVYLSLCVVFVLSLTKVHCIECDPGYFSLSTHILMCNILAPLLMVSSSYYLHREIKQFLCEYKVVFLLDSKYDNPFMQKLDDFFRKFGIALKNHFVDDIWNILDLCAFLTQLLTDVLYFTDSSNVALGFAAVSILFGFWKILFYARGFYEHWGPFVKMIQKSIVSMSSFVLVLVVFLGGYAFAFTILLNAAGDFDSPSESMKQVTLMVYGQFSDDILDNLNGWRLTTILFELLLLTCVVMMLNLLVAILSDSYTEVKENSTQATMFELANIIVELERVNKFRAGTFLHVDFWRHRHEVLFPTWLHALKPTRKRRGHEVKDEMEIKFEEMAVTIGKIQSAQEETHAMIAELKKVIKKEPAESQAYNKHAVCLV